MIEDGFSHHPPISKELNVQYHSKKHGVYPTEAKRVFMEALAKHKEVLLVPQGPIGSLNEYLPEILGNDDQAKKLIKNRFLAITEDNVVIWKLYLADIEKTDFPGGAIFLPWASVQKVLRAMTLFRSSDTFFIAQSGPGNQWQDDLTRYLKSFPDSKPI